MTQRSLPWNNIAIGQGKSYTWDELHAFFDKVLVYDNTLMGVIGGYGAELAVVYTVANQVTVWTGAAIVAGRFYELPANKVISGLTNSTTGQIVLQKIWANGEVRAIARSTGALVQTYDTQWEIPLADYSVDGAGVVTVTDKRVFALSPLTKTSDLTGASGLTRLQLLTIPATGSLIFPSISQNFKHLMVQLVTQSSYGGANYEELWFRLNGDTGANYDYNRWYGTNNTVTPGASYAQTHGHIGFTATSTGAGIPLGTSRLYFMNYADGSKHKAAISINGVVDNTSAGAGYISMLSNNLWRSTNPITQIEIYTENSANFLTRYSQAILYGFGG